MSTAALDKAKLLSAIDAMPTDRLTGVRLKAAERFAAEGFPTVGQEDWKYTNLASVSELTAEWLNNSASGQVANQLDAGKDLIEEVTGSIDADWLVIRDGKIDPNLPVINGVHIERISEQNNHDIAVDDALSAFNAALLHDGLRIHVEKGTTPDRPIGLLFIDDPSNQVKQTRIIVELEANSRLQIIDCKLSTSSGRQFTNSVTEVQLEAAANLDYTGIQDRDHFHSGTNKIQVHLERDAAFHHNSFDFGGMLSRNDVVTDIAGPGASVELDGLYLASGEQHIDNHTSIIHGVGPSTSQEEYRGILTGKSQCVFNGKVIVAEGADGTDSSQSNHNLLLSNRAEIDTKPELEIYADDVKCAHGATVGQLDKAALFYLRSRGLDTDQAKQILTRAFAAGTLSTLSVDACREFVAARLDRRLAALVVENNE